MRGLLPQKYSPLRANGDGLHRVYLAEVGRSFAAALFRLIGGEANQVADVAKAKELQTRKSPRLLAAPVGSPRGAVVRSPFFPSFFY